MDPDTLIQLVGSSSGCVVTHPLIYLSILSLTGSFHAAEQEDIFRTLHDMVVTKEVQRKERVGRGAQ